MVAARRALLILLLLLMIVMLMLKCCLLGSEERGNIVSKLVSNWVVSGLFQASSVRLWAAARAKQLSTHK